MSNTALTVLNDGPTALAQPGGLGVDFSSKFFQLKPATLGIVQANTQAEGAIKGKLRVSETGDQFDSMFVTLLTMPKEMRQYYPGKKGEMNRSPENLMCFCNNVTRTPDGRYETSGPDPRAKVPGALKCHGCPKASWDKYRQTKDRDDIPPCELFYKALLIDTEFKMPLQMYIRSTSKKPFEQAMENIGRKLMMMQSKGLNPNIFDIGFKISVQKKQNGNLVTYTPIFSDFNVITAEQKAEFGEIFQQFTARMAQPQAPADEIADHSDAIDGEVIEPSGAVPGEIAI